MKGITALSLLLGLALLTSAARADQTYYSCNFDDFKSGDLQGQSGWQVRSSDGYSAEDNVATVGDYAGRRCVKIDKATGWDGVVTKSLGSMPDNQLGRVSFRMNWSSSASASYVQISGHWWSRPIIVRFDRGEGDTFYLKSISDSAANVPEALKGRTFPMGEWLEVSYVLDFRSGNCQSLTVAGVEGDLTGVPIRQDQTTFKSFSVVGDSGLDFLLDDILVESVDRPSAPVLYLEASRVTVESKPTSYSLGMRNGGTQELTYTATATPDFEWLTIANPSGSFTTSGSLKLNFNRGIMDTNVYHVTIEVDGGAAGRRSCDLTVRSKGALVYYDFDDPPLHLGEISGQDGWTGIGDDGYTYLDNSLLVTNVSFAYDGPCAVVRNAHGWDSYCCPVNSGTDDVIRVSMMLRKDSDGSVESFYFRNNWWSNLGEIWFWRHEDHFYLYKFQNEKSYSLAGATEFPLDTWLPFSYTYDLRLYCLTSLTIGDFTTNYPAGAHPLAMDRQDATKRVKGFDRLAIICGGNEVTDAGLAIDNLSVVQVERPKEPVPELAPIVSVNADEDSVGVLVMNRGSKGFSYTLSVLDMPEVLEPSPAKGKIGTQGKLNFNVNASSLQPGFYRTRVVMDYKATSGAGAGSITSLFTIARGGYYYTTEFEGGTYNLGPLNGQDTWTAGGENGGQAPYIDCVDGVQGAFFPEDSHAATGCLIPCDTPFTFRCRLFVEDLPDPAVAVFSQIDHSGYMPFYVVRDPDLKAAQLGYFKCDSEDFEVVAEAPLDQWNDFSYTMDTTMMVSCVKSLTFGDFTTNFSDDDFFLDPAYDGCAISNLLFRAYNASEEEGSEEVAAGFRLDNVQALDPAIPEPAALLALAALLAAALRRAR